MPYSLCKRKRINGTQETDYGRVFGVVAGDSIQPRAISKVDKMIKNSVHHDLSTGYSMADKNHVVKYSSRSLILA
ncbi:predicted protein [Sclerotinia sclerotiorum 1980 UF-70]|uniref:Uncharacterized protein n=1 Tax=Sclerotinia sclerotiorum (strain ATCC 18683 / 1980 / Ss-1) TaxID=665079 RepID=A7ENJ3_SCLS1|nr:predicted protein [Sclerotinia sclerotiorum 1980 UF-70]EDO04409.1 predicted protein [Sclerotinia sclerotiorum 1980 UF-70]